MFDPIGGFLRVRELYITYLETVRMEPQLALEPYVGEYEGGRTISLRDSRLHYAGDAGDVGGGLMHAIAPDTFMLNEGDVTVVFQRDPHGTVVGLEYRWSLRPAGTRTAAKVH